MPSGRMPREPEPELMDLVAEAEAYAQADFSAENSAYVTRLFELVGDLEHARVVDLGTGPADIPLRITAERPSWHLTGVDGSTAMLDIARVRIQELGLSNNIRLLQADSKSSELDSSSFDVVLSNSLLHHVSDPVALWREVRRIAAPGALIFMRDLGRPRSVREAQAIVSAYAGEQSELLQVEFYRSLLSAWTPQEIRSQLAEVGLQSLRIKMVSDRHLDVWGRLPAG